MRNLRALGVPLFLAIAIAPCAHGATSVVWNSSTHLQGVVVIPVGETVSVSPKTSISLSAGTKIIVNGALEAPAGLTLSGSNWGGIVINGSANLLHFSESGAQISFQVNAKGKLAIKNGNISGISGASIVEGSFTADHLNYDKGSGGGIDSYSGTGSVNISNSSLHGSGRNTGDFFGMYNVKSISLSNSVMNGSHCAFHILSLQNMSLKSDKIQDNSYGFMMYGSTPVGTKTILNTSITNNSFGFDEGSSSTHNGAITISHSFISGNGQDLGLYTGKVKVVAALDKKPI